MSGPDKEVNNHGKADEDATRDPLLVVTEQPGSARKDSTSSTKSYPLLGSCRLTIAIVGFLGFVNLYAQRVNMSVAMVCMVNNTALQLKAVPVNTSMLLDMNLNRTGPLVDQCGIPILNTSHVQNSIKASDGEFDWPKSVQGDILASFFYGYTVTQVPGGWLSHRLGGTRVFGWSMLVCAVATLLMPVGARLHYGVLIFLRILAGLMQGVAWPAMHGVWAFWSPPMERSILIGGTFAGAQIGNVVALSASGLLCAYGFDGGWPTIFYVFGGLGVVWVVAWMYFVYDKPSMHPRISPEERVFIENSLRGQMHGSQSQSIPWLSFLTSVPLWAINLTHMFGLWGVYTFLTNIPTYMAEILKFDVKANGLLSALPYVGFWIVITVSAPIADTLRRKKILSTTWTRKLFNTIGQLGPALFLVILANVRCDQTVLAVVVLIIGVSLSGTMFAAGFIVNHADIAPAYAGLLFGITNAFGAIPGFVAPILIGRMTSNKLLSEWQTVFYLTAGVFCAGAVVYLIFGSGEVQPWAMPQTAKRPSMEVAMEEVTTKNGEMKEIDGKGS